MKAISRREFVGAAAAMALLAGCSTTPEETTDPTPGGSEAEPQTEPEGETEPEEEPELEPEPEKVERKKIVLTPCEYEEQEIWCERDGLAIYGVAYIPKLDSDELPPLVICCHGMGGNHTDPESFAQHFASNGLAAYAFDFNGGGPATSFFGAGNQSEGATTDMSVMTERDDILAVVEAAREWDFCDAEQLYLLGNSQGGVASTIAAEVLGDEVMGLMLNYPAFVMHDDAVKMYPSKDDIPEETNFMGTQVGRIYFADSWDFDFEDTISKVTCPIIINHGTVDMVVNYSYSERAAEASGAELHIIEGAGHGFMLSQLTEVYANIDAWLESL